MRTLTYRVTEADDGRQIKHVLKSRLGISHRQLSRLKNCDGMHSGGASVHANHVVHTGELLEILLEVEGEAAPCDAAIENDALDRIQYQEKCAVPSAALTASVCAALDERFAPQLMHLSPSGNARTQAELAGEMIVYEDEDMIIVNKPAPLPTGASARQDGLTLESVLCARYMELPGWQFRPVNRLDKGTSGLMAVAKTAHAHYQLQRQLHTPDFERTYRAITDSAPVPAEGVIDLPIGRETDSIVKRRICADGRPCRTHYRTLAVYGGLALVGLTLETGRTHQIRVHMAALGCPVYGDFLYGTEQPEMLPGRFALHSARLVCVQPVTGVRLEFDAPLPKELAVLFPGGY